MGEKTTAEDTIKNMDDEPYDAEITNSQKGANNMKADRAALAFTDVDYSANNARATRHKKRSKKAPKCNQIKRAKLMENSNVLTDVAEDSSQTKKVDCIGNHAILSHVEDKSNIRANKASPSLRASVTMPANDSTLAKMVKSLNKNNSHMLVVDLIPLLDNKDGSSASKRNKQRKAAMQTCTDPKELAEHNSQNQNLDKVSKPIKTSNSSKPKRKIEKDYRDPGASKTLSKNVCTLIKGIEPMQLADESMPAVDVFVPPNDKEGISRSQKLKSSGNRSTSNTQKVTDLGSVGKKISSKVTCIPADDPRVIAPNDCQYIYAEKSQLSGKPSDYSPKMNNSLSSMTGILHKCEKRPNNIQCSFCHSVEDSEVYCFAQLVLSHITPMPG